MPLPLNDPTELAGDPLPLAWLGLLPALCDIEDWGLVFDSSEAELPVLDGALELGVDESPELGIDSCDDATLDGCFELEARLSSDSLLLGLEPLAVDGDEMLLVDTLEGWLDTLPELPLDSVPTDADESAFELSSLDGAPELGTEDTHELSPDGCDDR